MVGIKEFRESVKNCMTHDEYLIEKLTIKNDGDRGYQVTSYKANDNMHLLGANNMGLELIKSKAYYEPSFRHVYVYIEKLV